MIDPFLFHDAARHIYDLMTELQLGAPFAV
jgi:hypothetical protein